MKAILVDGPADGREIEVQGNTQNLIIPVAPNWDKAKYVCVVRDEDGCAFFQWTGTTKANGDSEVVQ